MSEREPDRWQTIHGTSEPRARVSLFPHLYKPAEPGTTFTQPRPLISDGGRESVFALGVRAFPRHLLLAKYTESRTPDLNLVCNGDGVLLRLGWQLLKF